MHHFTRTASCESATPASGTLHPLCVLFSPARLSVCQQHCQSGERRILLSRTRSTRLVPVRGPSCLRSVNLSSLRAAASNPTALALSLSLTLHSRAPPVPVAAVAGRGAAASGAGYGRPTSLGARLPRVLLGGRRRSVQRHREPQPPERSAALLPVR